MSPEIPRFIDKPYRVREDNRTLDGQYETKTAALAVARGRKRAGGTKLVVVNVKTSETWDV